MSPVSVFISSTCYELTDLRSELIRFLEQHNFLVRASDDYESMFEVQGKLDSIATCLHNVEGSDVIVCIIDRRYGPPTGIGPYTDVSATHAEIKHAVKHGKPVFTFVRDQSYMETEQILRDDSFRPRWLDSKFKVELSRFVNERKNLKDASSRGTSNWFDLFKNSFELRPLVLKRLLDQFPGHIGVFARKPEKIVRLYFQSMGGDSDGRIKGRFINAGNGPALDISIGWSADGNDRLVTQQGALLVGESIPAGEKGVATFSTPKRTSTNKSDAVVYCEYQNASGDRYRIDVVHSWGEAGYTRKHPEQFKIRVGDQWLQIN